MIAGGIALVSLPATAQAKHAKVLATYCSPTGDFCQGVFKRPLDGRVYMDFQTFSFRGEVRVCVTKATRVCKSSWLRSVGDGVYRAKITWTGNYPYQGRGRYSVAWWSDGSPIGRHLHFGQ